MKYFYIATNNFVRSGHPTPTLKALCQNSSDPVILFASPQEESFRNNLPAGCSLVEFLPATDIGRYVAPPVLGAEIAGQLGEHGIESDDLVVLKMPFPYLLLSVVYALTLSRVSEIGPRLSVLVSQTDEGYASEQIKYSDCFRVIESLPPKFRDRIALVHEREVLLQHWRQQFPLLRMGVCGYVSEWRFGNLPDLAYEKPEHSLVYLGEARAQKGFTILADLVATDEICCDVVVHCEANPNNMNDDYAKAMRQLQEVSRRRPRIHLVAQKQNNCYEAAFHRKAIALMLYSPEYRMRGSGVLQECATTGMFVIAYDDLDFHVDFPQNVLTVARNSDPAALARAVQACIDQITTGKRQVPQPNALTATTFRELLRRPHLEPANCRTAQFSATP